MAMDCWSAIQRRQPQALVREAPGCGDAPGRSGGRCHAWERGGAAVGPAPFSRELKGDFFGAGLILLPATVRWSGRLAVISRMARGSRRVERDQRLAAAWAGYLKWPCCLKWPLEANGQCRRF
jgi:hypothetical protein